MRQVKSMPGRRVHIGVEKNAAEKVSPLHRWESDEAVNGFCGRQ